MTTAVDTNDPILANLPEKLHELPERWVRQRPDNIALSDMHRTTTYEELQNAVTLVADALRAHGVRAGDRVALVTENYVSAAVAFYAISACDAVITPINARVAAREVDMMMVLLQPRCVMFVGESKAAMTHCAGKETLVVSDPSLGALHLGPIAEDVSPDAGPPPAAIMFTSGTTGQPKGVMHSHAALLFQAGSQVSSRKVTEDDTLYIVAPLAHTIGLGSNLLTASVAGAEARLVPRFDPADLAQAVAAGKVTFLVAVPQVYAKLLDYIDAEGIDISDHKLRFTGTGGTTVDLTLIERMEAKFGLTLGNGYGCTEMTPIARVYDGVRVFGDAIGQPAPGCEIRIMREDGTEAALGEVGEIWARGPSRMTGYYKDPEATAAAITSDGWLRTSDMGRLDADGNYYIAGRNKEMIIRSGFNVYPAEVEVVINQFPNVLHSAVLGRQVPGDEEIIAFVQSTGGTKIDEDALRQHCRRNLSGYKMPKTIVFTDLPIGPTGKIMKNALTAQMPK